MERCMQCGEALSPGFVFCEACGARVDAAPTGGGAAPDRPVEAARAQRYGPALRCQCGGTDFDDGFCSACGLKMPLSEAPEVTAFSSLAATATHRGRRHRDNQDAVAIGEAAGGLALAVADGVSTSWQARKAADTAVGVALAALRDPQARPARERLADAVMRAHRAICELDYGVTDLAEPQATLVLALIEGETLSYAWVGDSRLYLFDGLEQRLLTEDDSWLNEQVKAGVALQTALGDVNAHAITQCLGMRDAEPVIHCAERQLRAGSWVLLCSDGLWNYFAEASVLWALVSAEPDDVALSTLCSHLVDHANAAGGHDNISAAVYHSCGSGPKALSG